MKIKLVAAAAALALAGSASAAQVDMTALTTIYNNGVNFVPGIPPGYTETKTSSAIDISNGITLSDGPHNLFSISPFSNFVATVDVTFSSTTNVNFTFGGFYIDTANGFAGIGFGPSAVAAQYEFNGSPQSYTASPVVLSSPAILELTLNAGSISAAYSSGGSAFVPIFTTSGFDDSFSQLDLTMYGGGAPGLSVSFANLAVSPVPEPYSWTLMIFGLGGVGLMLRRGKKTLAFRYKDALGA